MSITFQAEPLRQQVELILQGCGSLLAEAQAVAANLVTANLSGHDSHGVGMLPRYVESVLEGGLIPNASVKITMDLGTMLALDGQRGFGQVVGEQAMQLGIARAQLHGSCIMTLAQAHHLGRIGHWAEMALSHGLVAIHFVNVLSRPVVAPWGGADGRFGTNPCCIGVPLAGREPFVLDFATSRVAQGKMRVAYNEGREVEPGLLIDAQGLPTTQPGVVVVPQTPGPLGGIFGALLPFGEHKGYGLAVACELLGGALSGGGTWHKPAGTARAVYNGMLTILIDPQRLGTQEVFEREALAFVDWLRQGPALAQGEGVLLAGEPERQARAARAVTGIELDDTTWSEIRQAAAKVKVQL
jgi:uncharacterized oxidoreductase